MGMYTELILKTGVRKDIPEIVDKILKFLFSDDDLEKPTELPDHPFFRKNCWECIGRSNSYYHTPRCLNYYQDGYLFSRSDLKNYEGEIESFLDWIDEYLSTYEGKVIGWSWYEEYDFPTLIIKKIEDKE